MLMAIFLLIITLLVSATISHFIVMCIQGRTAEIININSFFNSIKTDKKHLLLFVSIFFLMYSVIMYSVFTNKNIAKAKTGMMKLTPEIEIPVSSGQKQYGSARFTTDAEQEKIFKTVKINAKNKTINALIKEGEKEKNAIKNGEIIDIIPIQNIETIKYA
ncbi:MAG: hypothetical protein RSE07_01910, partial [Oscillospiraceae bacterium]